MGNYSSSWSQTYEAIKENHDAAYKAIDAAITLEEQEKPREIISLLKIELDRRWVEIFRHLRVEHIPHENLKVLIEISLCCLGTSAAVERVFSLGNDYWSSEKSQLSVKTLSAVLTVKFNMQNESCSDVATLLDEHPHLAKKIHSEEKYVFKRK